MTIGVFDSGVGGLSVANAIRATMPEHKVILREDKQNLPYGTKTPEELLRLVSPILQDLAQQCDVIVVACNTVSTTLINKLREIITVPLVAMEPMIKPAAERTKSKVIAVCATPTTLASERYVWLKETYVQGIQVLEPDCSDWALMVETDTVDRQKIHDRIDKVCKEGADVIVLGCTHYHWIEDVINEVADGRATVIQPEEAIIRRLQTLIAER